MHPRNPMGRIVHSSVYAFLPTTFLQLGIYEALFTNLQVCNLPALVSYTDGTEFKVDTNCSYGYRVGLQK